MGSGKLFLLGTPLFSVLGTSFAKADPGVLVNVDTRTLYVPVGFDDNDETQVVIEGYLPDTCHKLAKAEVTKDFANGRILIQAKARRSDNGCLDMIVPFKEVVRLGQVPEGTYAVLMNNGKIQESLAIKAAPVEAADDYSYTPVDAVKINYLPNKQYEVIIEGRFMNSCASVQKVLPTVTGKTIQVLPIMKAWKPGETGGTCSVGEYPFRTQVTLPALETEKYSRFLLHVRSLDGSSINEIFPAEPPEVN